jgi:hypothetical protein
MPRDNHDNPFVTACNSSAFRLLGQYFQWGLPESYFVIAIKATGVPPNDIILRISSTWYMEGKMCGKLSSPLYAKRFVGSEAWQLLGRCKQKPDWRHIDNYELQRSGYDPVRVLSECHDVLCAMPRGTPIVGHALCNFGWRMLRQQFNRWVDGYAAELDSIPILDVGLMEKAILGGLYPWQGETLNSFQSRIGQEQISVKWSLGDCLARRGITLDWRDDRAEVVAVDLLYRSLDSMIRSVRPPMLQARQ